MTFYQILILVHVLSAILGLGPGFIMIYVVTRASTMTELRHAYLIRNRLHIFVMIGGTILLLTGLAMGILNPYWFRQGWYITSLTLFLIALGFGPAVLSPLSKPIKKLLKEHQGDDIPVHYNELIRKLFFYERIENVLFIIIIVLMVLKPDFQLW
ncbi:MAG TPA: DUF2269 family protein [Saprospiraceae bacterium]|nr:MAG: hypothetical protein UZ08_BCD001003011 [Candidatus Parvibacillus calidus]MBX2937135.1 DUF2269 domain-containing protein [Saprospiraceae bacterium]MBK7741286.1 DUF2269 domain-containing protein [Candidatus Parvibacillus calidus]MBX7178592.1 DUF2269 domain-containing protein [Saprospiraceae bacterium]MCB0592196.1 DUF2269 domain-containing protein [Saprospiraceae bacterium]